VRRQPFPSQLNDPMDNHRGAGKGWRLPLGHDAHTRESSRTLWRTAPAPPLRPNSATSRVRRQRSRSSGEAYGTPRNPTPGSGPVVVLFESAHHPVFGFRRSRSDAAGRGQAADTELAVGALEVQQVFEGTRIGPDCRYSRRRSSVIPAMASFR
jgi:hypothetical protein